MFIAVDLPEPLGPMMATNSPSRDHQVHATQRLQGHRALAVGLGDADQVDQGAAARASCPAAFTAWFPPRFEDHVSCPA